MSTINSSRICALELPSSKKGNNDNFLDFIKDIACEIEHEIIP